jgi:hypothetical protein
MALVAVGTRIPESWQLELDELGEKLGLSRGALLKDAIALYLKKTTPETMTTQIKDILLRLDTLEQRHRALSVLVATGGEVKGLG